MSRRVPGDFDAALFVAACKANGLSPAELAARADISATAVYSWIHGKSKPYIDNLARAAQVLGMSAGDFIRLPQSSGLAGLRATTGKSSRQIAAAIGVSEAVLDNLERGRTALTAARAEQLSAALGCQVEQVRAAYEQVRPPAAR